MTKEDDIARAREVGRQVHREVFAHIGIETPIIRLFGPKVAPEIREYVRSLGVSRHFNIALGKIHQHWDDHRVPRSARNVANLMSMSEQELRNISGLSDIYVRLIIESFGLDQSAENLAEEA